MSSKYNLLKTNFVVNFLPGVHLRIVDNDKSTDDKWHLLGPNQVYNIVTILDYILDEKLFDKGINFFFLFCMFF